MVLQTPDTVENKLSVKLKVVMVGGAVIVLVGATFAGYYFGQKKTAGVLDNRNIISDEQMANSLPLTPGPIVTNPVGGGIASEDNPEPEKYIFPTTKLPREIEQKIVWSEPKEIPNLKWFQPDIDSAPEEDYRLSKYYEVGKFSYEGASGRIILVELPPEGPGTPWFFHIVDFKNQLVVLTKYSNFSGYLDNSSLSYYLATFVKEIQGRVSIDSNFTIGLLEFPKILTGPKTGQVLNLAGIYQIRETWFGNSDLAKIKAGSEVVFSDSKFGQVYSLSSNGGFYLVGAHGAFAAYSLRPDFFNKDSELAQIVWSDGSWNGYEYTYGDVGGCGSRNYISVVSPGELVIADDLLPIGKTSKGDTVYELKDKNNVFLKKMYDSSYYPGYNQEKVSYEEFLATKPMIFWVDPFGRLIKMENRRFIVPAECGKPVIYLYPEKTSVVDVKVEPQGGMTVSDPFYNGGWQVKAEPNGQLTELKSGKQYPYLFWEGRGGLYQTPERGFVMKKEDIATELPEKLAHLGLNVIETKDFMEFWYPRMQAKPYYFVTFLGTKQMNQLAPLTINPRPDTVVRILMDFTPLDKPIDVLPLSLGRTPQRKGFTVIEWGGVLR